MSDHFLHVADIALEKLDPAAALAFVADPCFGGATLFLGRVRDHNHGRDVLGVSYDIHRPLALVRFAQIAVEIEREVGGQLKLYIAHAHGRLAVGEIAVVIAAGTPHRDEAFRACRQAIEAVKHSAPIWKQEQLASGESEWVRGS